MCAAGSSTWPAQEDRSIDRAPHLATCYVSRVKLACNFCPVRRGATRNPYFALAPTHLSTPAMSEITPKKEKKDKKRKSEVAEIAPVAPEAGTASAEAVVAEVDAEQAAKKAKKEKKEKRKSLAAGEGAAEDTKDAKVGQ